MGNTKDWTGCLLSAYPSARDWPCCILHQTSKSLINTCHINTCHRNTCHRNTCHRNTCHVNTCHRNTCRRNTCHRNTCHINTCHRNTCHRNTCHINTCHRNTCHINTCHINTCHRNTCHRNTCHRNTCHINVLKPQFRCTKREIMKIPANLTYSNKEDYEELKKMLAGYDRLFWKPERKRTTVKGWSGRIILKCIRKKHEIRP